MRIFPLKTDNWGRWFVVGKGRRKENIFFLLSTFYKFAQIYLVCNEKLVSSINVEEFNSIVRKFIGGRRINYCLKRSYQVRCCAARVAHNSKRPVYKFHVQLQSQ